MITIFDVLCALARANDENRRLRNALAEALTTLDIEQWAYGVVLRDHARLTAELERKENALAEVEWLRGRAVKLEGLLSEALDDAPGWILDAEAALE
jgi:hypothetical protein